ncbi:element excision factor XisI family protein [Haliscomenobacter sp.]
MQNWTEEEVAEELLQLGVPAGDIVLGFMPEEGRVYSGFGVD